MTLFQKLPIAITALALTGMPLAISPAMAATTEVHIKTKDVSILGFDLSDRADATRLLKQITTAAKRVCTISTHRETMRERVLRRQCAEKATDIAVQSLNSPTLNAVWQESQQN